MPLDAQEELHPTWELESKLHRSRVYLCLSHVWLGITMCMNQHIMTFPDGLSSHFWGYPRARNPKLSIANPYLIEPSVLERPTFFCEEERMKGRSKMDRSATIADILSLLYVL